MTSLEAPQAWAGHSPATPTYGKSCILGHGHKELQTRLQNNTVCLYLCVYITTDVAGDFLKSFYWDNHSCLQWRLGDLVAGKG